MTRRDAALLYRLAANDASRQLVLRLCGRHLEARQRQLAAAVNGKEGAAHGDKGAAYGKEGGRGNKKTPRRRRAAHG